MKTNDEILFLRRESATIKVRTKIVDPTKTAAFATSLKACIFSDITPASLPIAYHILHQLWVFLWRPKSLLHLLYLMSGCNCYLWFPHFFLLIFLEARLIDVNEWSLLYNRERKERRLDEGIMIMVMKGKVV